MDKRQEKEEMILHVKTQSIDERLELLSKAAKIKGRMIKQASQIKIGREEK